jgi:hypothetical protein
VQKSYSGKEKDLFLDRANSFLDDMDVEDKEFAKTRPLRQKVFTYRKIM